MSEKGISEAASEIDPGILADNGMLAQAFQAALSPSETTGGISEAASDIEEGAGISEAASENKAKAKPKRYRRGRPRRFFGADPAAPAGSAASYDHSFLWMGVHTEATTPRGRINSEYAYIACNHLFAHRERHPELLSLTGLGHYEESGTPYPAAMFPKKNERARWPMSALAELGRLICDYSDGGEVAVEWAIEWANMQPKPTVKQATAWLRNRRLGRVKAGNAEGLLGAIFKAVDGYLERFPATPRTAIVEALEIALIAFDDDDNEVESESN